MRGCYTHNYQSLPLDELELELLLPQSAPELELEELLLQSLPELELPQLLEELSLRRRASLAWRSRSASRAARASSAS